jgi:hypothetical protein
MTTIRVTPMEPQAFGVEIDEGATTTGHRVIVPSAFCEDRNLPGTDDVTVVRESIGFLLDRFPGTAIPDEFSLDDLSRDHADFIDELRSRVSAASGP